MVTFIAHNFVCGTKP